MGNKEIVKAKAKSINLMLSLFAIIFIFIFSFSVSALNFNSVADSQLVQSSDGSSNNQPFARTLFLPNGIDVYESSLTPIPYRPNIYHGQMSTPFDLSTLNFNNDMNQTFLIVHGGGSADSTSLIAFYLTEDGSNLYLAYSNHIDFQTDTWLEIDHYILTQNRNLSSAVLSDNVTLNYENNGFFSYIITGMYVSSNGDNLITIGSSYSTTGNFNGTRIKRYLMSSSNHNFNVSTMQLQQNIITPDINATQIFFRDDGMIMFTLDNSHLYEYPLLQYFNVSSAFNKYLFNFAITGSINSAIMPYDILNDTFFLTNMYNLNSDGKHYRKFQMTNLAQGGGGGFAETNVSTGLLDSLINPVVSLFPDKDSLTLKQRYGYVAVVMFIVAVILLFAGGSLNKGISPVLLWIMLIIEVVLFFFFTAIGYIPIGVLIMMALIAIIIGYFKFRNNGGS